MRNVVLAILLAPAACNRGTPSAGLPSSPDTTGIEGHGGIAIEEKQPPLAIAPRPSVAPRVEASSSPAELRPTPQDAHAVYLEAYSIKDTDPGAAQAKFREVVRRAPGTSDAAHAQRWVEQLSPDVQILK